MSYPRKYVTIRFGGVDTPLIRIPVLDDEVARVNRVSGAGHDLGTLPEIVLRPGEELIIRCDRVAHALSGEGGRDGT